jgi:hypothetical protein
MVPVLSYEILPVAQSPSQVLGITANAATIAAAISTFAPLVVAWITKKEASDRVKAVINLLAVAVATAIALVWNGSPDGTPLTWQTVLMTFGSALVASIVAYKGRMEAAAGDEQDRRRFGELRSRDAGAHRHRDGTAGGCRRYLGMSAWVVVPNLLKLRDEFNLVSPKRDKGSDGTIGDSNHNSSSDHTPDEDSRVLKDHDADNKNEGPRSRHRFHRPMAGRKAR